MIIIHRKSQIFLRWNSCSNMVKLIKLPFSYITLGMVNAQLMIGHHNRYMVKTDAVSRSQYYCLEQQQQQLKQQQPYQQANITSTFLH